MNTKSEPTSPFLSNSFLIFLTSEFFFFLSVSVLLTRNDNRFFLMFQGSWEKRILKSLNSMCTELSIPLARKVLLTFKYFNVYQALGSIMKI